LKLIIPVSNSAPPKADPALLKAIAHSRRWFDDPDFGSGSIADGNRAKRWHQPLRQVADAARLYRAGE